LASPATQADSSLSGKNLGEVLVRLSAYASLVFGVWGALAVLWVLGAWTGLALGVLALVCGSAALTEGPNPRVRRVALLGVTSGALAVAGFLVWVLLVVLGV
jgi:hypothetical protein